MDPSWHGQPVIDHTHADARPGLSSTHTQRCHTTQLEMVVEASCDAGSPAGPRDYRLPGIGTSRATHRAPHRQYLLPACAGCYLAPRSRARDVAATASRRIQTVGARLPPTQAG